MSVAYLCDGCARPVTEPKKVGHVTPREYCPDCAPRAEQFVAAEEAARVSMQAEFVKRRNALIDLHSADGFALPDVP